MKIVNFFIVIYLTFSSYLPLEARRNLYRLDISRNEFGLHPGEYICKYDDVAKSVECKPIDPNRAYTSDRYFFPNVYVRKLTSDPTGIGFLGFYLNPNLNPGLPNEYTSTRALFPFGVYVSKY